jgi:FdhD protein
MSHTVEQCVVAGAARFVMQRMTGDAVAADTDALAVEEPLEIRIAAGNAKPRAISVTMRTPGNDLDLAVGFLWTEGIITESAQVRRVSHCGTLKIQNPNVVRVDLSNDVRLDWERLERHFFTSSSCGVCGKTSLDAVRTQLRNELEPGIPHDDAAMIHRLPAALRRAQTVFERTGGIHAAGLFDVSGTLLEMREDVGRHNALDKVIGAQVRARNVPLSRHIVLLSGRGSFELVQKACMAGIPIVAAVGPPSSLAVELARECGLTLIGFVRDDRFNIYCGADRIQGANAMNDGARRSHRLPLQVR